MLRWTEKRSLGDAAVLLRLKESRQGTVAALICLGKKCGYTFLSITGHVWLHSRCWPVWHAGRKAEAIAALAAMGIAEPNELPDDFRKNEGG